jgi:SAM-dependent methyltransferase
MSGPSTSISQSSYPDVEEREAPRINSFRGAAVAMISRAARGVNVRYSRERRRRAVGRAYDMALEIARVIPGVSDVLDVGCGNGFIAHHLSAMTGGNVVGVDLGDRTQAPIKYRRYREADFPVASNSFNAVLLCYVLHHAQDAAVVLSEVRRALRPGGRAIIYEDIPQTWLDGVVCWLHNRQWRSRTGPCTFRRPLEWRALFESFGFEVVSERPLSRWRNLTHPVSRRFYVLKLNSLRH